MCNDIDSNHVKNVTCFVKAERNKLGVLNTEYTFVEAVNVIYELVCFSRNSHGHYQPFLMAIKIDVCDVVSSNSTFDFGLKNFLAKEMVRAFPAFWKGCPVSVRNSSVFL